MEIMKNNSESEAFGILGALSLLSDCQKIRWSKNRRFVRLMRSSNFNDSNEMDL